MVRPNPPGAALWPTAPTAEAWAAMSPEERARAVERVEAMELPDELRESMSEGDAHLDAKIDIRETLRAYFKKSGRSIYVGAELAVFYPGQRVFSPDIIAVRDVEPRRRRSWFVSAEGEGLDLALEVLSHGDSKKDLVGNLTRYASLNIQEYFVLDLERGMLLGHHLAAAGAGKYQRLLPQAGRLSSAVLGLELAIADGRLRFYQGTAELLSNGDLVAKLERMLDDVVARQSEERGERERAEAERDRAEEQLRRGILAILAARRIEVAAEHEALVRATRDAELLGRWIVRAAAVTDAAQLFADD